MRAARAACVMLVMLSGAVFMVGCCDNGDFDQGPPGPIIDVDPGTSPDPGILAWYVTDDGDRDEQTTNGGPIYPDCELRSDFIGKRMMNFTMCTAGDYPSNCTADYPNPKKIRLTSADGKVIFTITIEKEHNTDRVYWHYQKRDPDITKAQACALVAGPVTAGQLPDEFSGLKLIHEISDPADEKAGTDFELRVQEVQ